MGIKRIIAAVMAQLGDHGANRGAGRTFGDVEAISFGSVQDLIIVSDTQIALDGFEIFVHAHAAAVLLTREIDFFAS